jgi:hypothetical protein
MQGWEYFSMVALSLIPKLRMPFQTKHLQERFGLVRIQSSPSRVRTLLCTGALFPPVQFTLIIIGEMLISMLFEVRAALAIGDASSNVCWSWTPG